MARQKPSACGRIGPPSRWSQNPEKGAPSVPREVSTYTSDHWFCSTTPDIGSDSPPLPPTEAHHPRVASTQHLLRGAGRIRHLYVLSSGPRVAIPACAES